MLNLLDVYISKNKRKPAPRDMLNRPSSYPSNRNILIDGQKINVITKKKRRKPS